MNKNDDKVYLPNLGLYDVQPENMYRTIYANGEKLTPEQSKELKELIENKPIMTSVEGCKVEVIPQMYQMIADENELRWFFDHVVERPKVHESYSAVFVSRHKKLTDEEAKTFGITRHDAEFLSVVTFRLRNVKDATSKDDPDLWSFGQFLQRVKRFNVDVGAYTTSTGNPIPQKTLAVIFYVNPCDDMKVCRDFVDEFLKVNENITKATLEGKVNNETYAQYQWFGKAESTIKHAKAKCKGSKYWMDFDVDVPKWFKETIHQCVVMDWKEEYKDKKGKVVSTHYYYNGLKSETYFGHMIVALDILYGKGNYVIVDTSGGYHILVRTSAIKSDPHIFTRRCKEIYDAGVKRGETPYLNEKGECKFECVVNDSQIPGLPLPGTYQYGRPVIVLNKEDFEDEI